jgi:acyl-ACP thioesterase
MENVEQQRFELTVSDVGPHAEARLDALMNFMQQTAAAQTDGWKLSVLDLLPRGKTWVLSRHHLRFSRYPRLGEQVEVRTWSSGIDGAFALREFELAAKGELLGGATSSWAVMDLKQKKPTPVAETLSDDYTVARRVIEDRFEPLPKLERTDREVGLRVMHRDLDINGHVNHTVYVQWAHEALPPELAGGWRPMVLEIGYRAEAFHGDEVVSRIQTLERSETEASFVHQIVNARTGVELTRLRTVWRPGRQLRRSERRPAPEVAAAN